MPFDRLGIYLRSPADGIFHQVDVTLYHIGPRLYLDVVATGRFALYIFLISLSQFFEFFAKFRSQFVKEDGGRVAGPIAYQEAAITVVNITPGSGDNDAAQTLAFLPFRVFRIQVKLAIGQAERQNGQAYEKKVGERSQAWMVMVDDIRYAHFARRDNLSTSMRKNWRTDFCCAIIQPDRRARKI